LVQDIHGEKMVLNMGALPIRPRTVCQNPCLNWTVEIITKATPDIGYLHRGDEKIAET